MAKFNQKSIGTKTTNRAGGNAYTQSDKAAFASLLLTSFVQDQFYRSESDTIKEVGDMIAGLKDKRFAAKAAVYARNEFGMRSISHVVANEIAATVKGVDWTKDFFKAVVRRPDDITEILALSMQGKKRNCKKLPNSLKKGLANAFQKFDGYQLGKYRGEGNAVSLVDAVNLVRPKPSEKNADALKELIEGKLRSTTTWEAKLTEQGKHSSGKSAEEKKAAKKESWEEMIDSWVAVSEDNEITAVKNYFAMLRNARNILEAGVSGPQLEKYVRGLTHAKAIKKSLVLPFRFVTAMEEIQKIHADGVSKVIHALAQATELSLSNIPKFDGETLVVIDSSGSMTFGKRCINIASLFGGALVKSNNADLMLFDGDAGYLNVNTLDSLSTIQNKIVTNCRGGSTNFHAPFQKARKAYDRIIILSDMQGWRTGGYGYNSAPTKVFQDYKRKYNCNPFVYSFDLQGYGTLQLPEDRVFCLAGFSEKVFDIMDLLETDRNALVNRIEEVSFV